MLRFKSNIVSSLDLLAGSEANGVFLGYLLHESLGVLHQRRSLVLES
jgi:hypothetical protein